MGFLLDVVGEIRDPLLGHAGEDSCILLLRLKDLRRGCCWLDGRGGRKAV